VNPGTGSSWCLLHVIITRHFAGKSGPAEGNHLGRAGEARSAPVTIASTIVRGVILA
jgi:hypothetical protein